MKVFLRIIAWIAAACILACGIPPAAVKAEDSSEVVASGSLGSITWTITKFYDEAEGYCSATVLDITGTGAMPDYKYQNSAPWFQDPNGQRFTGINISEGITRIGSYAFCPTVAQYNAIDTVVIPESVSEIGEYAFYYQEDLDYARIPDSVTALGTCAFSHKTTIICSSRSAAYPFAKQNDYYGNPIILTDLEITLTLGEDKVKEVTLNRGEEVSYNVSTNVADVTPKITYRPAGALEVDTEKQILRAATENAPNGPTVTVTASAYGASASCTVNIRKVYTVHLWEGFYDKDLGTETYNEGTTYEPDYHLTREGYVLAGWYTAEKVWSSGSGCFVIEFTRVTSVSDRDVELFSFWSRDIAAGEIASIPVQTYTGKAITPDVTVTLDGKTLTRNTDYTLSYKNNVKSGEATAVITGIGSYGGTAEKKFTIRPAGTSVISLKNSAKKTVTVKWKKAKTGSGYQIQYGLKKNMKGAKSVTVKALKTTSAKLKGLKKGKAYYVRIRVFRNVNGKKIYSKWSAVKKVKVTR